jgi:hypothetical protein
MNVIDDPRSKNEDVTEGKDVEVQFIIENQAEKKRRVYNNKQS